MIEKGILPKFLTAKSWQLPKNWSFTLSISLVHLLKKFLMENFIFCAVDIGEVNVYQQNPDTGEVNAALDV